MDRDVTRTPGRPGLPDQELALSRICSAILSCACWAVPNVVTPRDKYPGISIPTPSRRAGTRRRQRKPPADAARPVRVPHPGKVQSAMDFESSYMSIRVTCASNFSEAAEKSEPDRRSGSTFPSRWAVAAFLPLVLSNNGAATSSAECFEFASRGGRFSGNMPAHIIVGGFLLK